MEGIWEIIPCPKSNQTTNYSLPSLDPNRTASVFMDAFLEVGYNFSLPCWDIEELPSRDTFKKIMDDLNIYLTPIIIVFGITGNIMSFLVFTMTHLRRQSSSIYLASLALADMGFLMCLCIVWLSWIGIPIFHRNIWCQIVVYLMYVCTFLSVWYVVSFTVERYIIVWYPLRKDRFCTRKRANIVVSSLAIIGCLIYSFAPWTSGIVLIHTLPLCIPFPQYYNFLTAMTGVDFALTLILPCLTVIILNIRIILKIINVDQKRQPVMRQVNYVIMKKREGQVIEARIPAPDQLSSNCIVHFKFQSQSNSSERMPNFHLHPETRMSSTATSGRKSLTRSSSSAAERDSTSCSHYEVKDQSVKKCKKKVTIKTSQFKTARMLIIVSTVFVILNLPSHVFRIHTFIQSSLHHDFHDRSLSRNLKWQEIFQLVYHLNFSINFFIYSACGRQFRHGLRILYARFSYKLKKIRKMFCSQSDFKEELQDVHPVNIYVTRK